MLTSDGTWAWYEVHDVLVVPSSPVLYSTRAMSKAHQLKHHFDEGKITIPARHTCPYTIEHISGFVASALEQMLLQYLLTPALHSLFNLTPKMNGESTGTPILLTRDEHNWMFNPRAAAQSASYFWDTYQRTLAAWS